MEKQFRRALNLSGKKIRAGAKPNLLTRASFAWRILGVSGSSLVASREASFLRPCRLETNKIFRALPQPNRDLSAALGAPAFQAKLFTAATSDLAALSPVKLAFLAENSRAPDAEVCASGTNSVAAPSGAEIRPSSASEELPVELAYCLSDLQVPGVEQERLLVHVGFFVHFDHDGVVGVGLGGRERV